MSTFVVETTSAACPAVVFGVLADAPRWQDWAGPVVPTSRWAVGSSQAGLGAVRQLGLGVLSGREEIIDFVPDRRLAYALRTAERLHHYRAVVELHDHSGGGTRIVWSGSAQIRLPGASAVLCALFRRLVAGFARRLARYAETLPPAQ